MAENGTKDRASDAVDPTALTVEQLAKMLQIPAEKVREQLSKK